MMNKNSYRLNEWIMMTVGMRCRGMKDDLRVEDNSPNVILAYLVSSGITYVFAASAVHSTSFFTTIPPASSTIAELSLPISLQPSIPNGHET